MDRKNIIKILVLALMIIGIIAVLIINYLSKSDIENVEIEIGESVTFTKQEIEQAINTVIEDFFEKTKNIELKKLSYNEEYSDERLKYSNRNVDSNNIIIFSDFYNYNTGGAWEPNSNYYWMFRLSRDNMESEWKLVGWGY